MSASRIDAPRFVGREDELARVVHVLTDPPALVLVEGEAGMGKSRLVREALREFERVTEREREPLVVLCPPFREPLTLGPIVEAARQRAGTLAGLGLSGLAGALRPLFPEWAGLLPPTPEPLDDAGAARHRVISALAELLERLDVAVLVIEDVHWADDATIDFLLFLASRRPQRISLLLTFRSEDLSADSPLRRLFARQSTEVGHTRVILDPLGLPQAKQLVSSMLNDGQVSASLAELLHKRTEGVPLVLEESVRLLHDRSDLVRRDGEWTRRGLGDIDVPPSVRDAVTERAARLGRRARCVLLAAAVLVVPESDAVLATVSGLPPGEFEAALDEALRSGLIAEDGKGRFAFRHALAAKAVLAAEGFDHRPMHRRAAALLEAAPQQPVARLAHHYREARDTTQWCRYAEEAADLALESGDHATAAGLLHDLLTEGELSGADTARIAHKLPLLAFTGYLRRVDVLDTLRSVLEDGRLDDRARGLVRAQIGRMLLHMGEFGAGAEELERAIPGLADEPAESARAMTLLGRPLGLLRPASEHLLWLQRAARVPDSAIDPDVRRMLWIDRVTALLDLGEASGWELAARFPSDELTSQDAMHLARFSLNSGNAAIHWGHYREARRHLVVAADIARRHGYQRLRDMALVTMAHLDWYAGSWSGLAERARHWAELDEEPLVQLDGRLVGGLLAAAYGHGAAAEDSVRTVVEESTRRGVPDMALESAGSLAGLRLDRGDVDGALELTEEGVEAITRTGMWLWATEPVPVRVAALLAARRSAEAEDLVERFGHGLGARHIPSARAALESCRAFAVEARGDSVRAAAAWGAAASAWQNLPRPYRALHARERRAVCLLRVGERAEALSLWTDVAQAFAALGAEADAERVERTLREHVATQAGGRIGRPGYGDQLSPREQEVVDLLLSGLTNREIAAQLSRSPRTVAAQLDNAMRKHGVTTRTALAVIVAQQRTSESDATAR